MSWSLATQDDISKWFDFSSKQRDKIADYLATYNKFQSDKREFEKIGQEIGVILDQID